MNPDSLGGPMADSAPSSPVLASTPLPALWHEAFGLTVREALAAGRGDQLGGLLDGLRPVTGGAAADAAAGAVDRRPGLAEHAGDAASGAAGGAGDEGDPAAQAAGIIVLVPAKPSSAATWTAITWQG